MTVFVVTGPPAGGKSTWVRERAQPGDVTIDYDTLAQALSPELLPADVAEQNPRIVAVVQAARTAAIDEAYVQYVEQVGMGDRNACNVYIVHAMPARQDLNRYRKYGFEIITVDPGYDECMRRATTERSERQQSIVQDWYQRRGLA